MESVTIYRLAQIIGVENIEFGEHVIVDDFVFIYAKKKITIGNYVHIAAFTSITGGERVSLGDFSGLSMGSRIFTSSEDFSGSGFGNPTVPNNFRNIKNAPVNVGQFAILGANCVVLPGVAIGEGCSVGANSVITRDLEPWGIYIGNKRVGERDKDGVLKNYEKFLRKSKISGVGKKN